MGNARKLHKCMGEGECRIAPELVARGANWGGTANWQREVQGAGGDRHHYRHGSGQDQESRIPQLRREDLRVKGD